MLPLAPLEMCALRNSCATDGGSEPDRIRAFAAELVSLAPDVIVTSPTPATRAVQQRTLSIPIVFTGGGDPVVNDLVQNIGRPLAM